ncbi:MAG TPA: hypothetical protein VGN18_18400 [Jatrophihabitans sp.]|uniref:LysM peptidoglycan-binding domain-containing protein n=1 Tax=Jatrophihabitans sp. TaxID=1932789 RepID=UPI002DF852D1|nr:hypothetical protein [Jatrophihabitans sp.]
MRSVRTALLMAGDAAALALLPGSAAEFVARVGRPRAWLLEVGVDRALVVAAGAAVWLAAAWLGVGLIAALGARLPGAAGRLGAAVGRRVLPRAVLGLLAGTAGIGVLLAPVAAGANPAPAPSPTVSAATVSAPAVPAPTWPTDPPPIAAPTWPTAAPTIATQATAAPTAAPPTTTTPTPHRSEPPAAAPTTHDAIRVKPGDSLWLLAGHRLGPDASDAETAAAWPRWYAANRAVIGADPAVIRPGQVLRSPTSATVTPTREEIR